MREEKADLNPAPATSSAAAEEVIVPVLAEELHIGKQAHATGGVRVYRRVEEHEETVELPLFKQSVDIRRVLIDREVEGPIAIRYEDNTTIIPVVEEIAVVTTRYVLKEEIHITSTVRQELHQERIQIKRQQAEVERLDANGQPTAERPQVTSAEDDRPNVPNWKAR